MFAVLSVMLKKLAERFLLVTKNFQAVAYLTNSAFGRPPWGYRPKFVPSCQARNLGYRQLYGVESRRAPRPQTKDLKDNELSARLNRG